MTHETKHTPGPWNHGTFTKHEGTYDRQWFYVRSLKGGTDVAHLPVQVSKLFAEQEANARLIGAAPELLEVARTALGALQARSETRQKWTVKDQQTFEQLEVAIAKAEGTP